MKKKVFILTCLLTTFICSSLLAQSGQKAPLASSLKPDSAKITVAAKPKPKPKTLCKCCGNMIGDNVMKGHQPTCCQTRGKDPITGIKN